MAIDHNGYFLAVGMPQLWYFHFFIIDLFLKYCEPGFCDIKMLNRKGDPGDLFREIFFISICSQVVFTTL